MAQTIPPTTPGTAPSNIRHIRPLAEPAETHQAHHTPEGSEQGQDRQDRHALEPRLDEDSPTPVVPVGPQTLETVAFRVGMVDEATGRRHSATLSTTFPPFGVQAQSRQTRLNIGIAAEALLESIGCRLEAIEFNSTATVEI